MSLTLLLTGRNVRGSRRGAAEVGATAWEAPCRGERSCGTAEGRATRTRLRPSGTTTTRGPRH
jgi:hypothetical protein